MKKKFHCSHTKHACISCCLPKDTLFHSSHRPCGCCFATSMALRRQLASSLRGGWKAMRPASGSSVPLRAPLPSGPSRRATAASNVTAKTFRRVISSTGACKAHTDIRAHMFCIFKPHSLITKLSLHQHRWYVLYSEVQAPAHHSKCVYVVSRFSAKTVRCCPFRE